MSLVAHVKNHNLSKTPGLLVVYGNIQPFSITKYIEQTQTQYFRLVEKRFSFLDKYDKSEDWYFGIF